MDAENTTDFCEEHYEMDQFWIEIILQWHNNYLLSYANISSTWISFVKLYSSLD